ncbi:MAG: glycosyltransferase [Candidatus Coatesbacteria bacterium]|nr:glycosyltransferase [Candidatus Coatesbacteria bacterium]
MKTNTTFVIVNLNGSRYLGSCIPAIEAQGDSEIILVDNGSSDDSMTIAEREFPSASIIENKENLGFAEAANQGLRASTTRYVAFVNTDVRLAPDWLSKILAVFASHDDVACVGGRLLNRDGNKYDFDGGTLNFYGFGQQVRFGSPLRAGAEDDAAPIEESLFVCGGAMVVDREALLRIGGFDDTFFAYFEDVDLGYRLWASGYRAMLTREAIGYHDHHGTSSRTLSSAAMDFLAEKNSLTLLLKNLEETNLARMLPASLIMNAARVVPRAKDALPPESEIYAATGPSAKQMLDLLNGLGDEISIPSNSLAGALAVIHVAANLNDIMIRRLECQSLRKRSDEEILSRFPGFFYPSFFSSHYFDIEKTLIRSFALDKVLGEDNEGRIFEKQMSALGGRLHEEIDRLLVSKADDSKHISGLEAALTDRQKELSEAFAALDAKDLEIRELDRVLGEKDRTIADALAAVKAKDSDIAERDRVLAEKEAIIRDAMASIANHENDLSDALKAIKERDEHLGRALESMAEKDALVQRFEELSEQRKSDVIELQKEIEGLQNEVQNLRQELNRRSLELNHLKNRIERIENSSAYRMYSLLKKLGKILPFSRRSE